MSYSQNPYGGGAYPNQPPGQYPPPQPGYGAPPQHQQGQHYPSQPGYGAPPQHQQGQHYPSQPAYGQQQGPPPPGPYGHPPPQGYPPPQQQGYPPQNYDGWQHQNQQQPPQGRYGGPPPHQSGSGGPEYPQGPYHPQQGQYPGMQPPPHQQGQYTTPPQQSYGHGAPPPHQQPHIMSARPSPGYDPGQKAHGDFSQEANALRKAMKGFGTDEKALINILTKPDPLQMALIRQAYVSQHDRNLEKDIESETTGNLEDGLLSLARGPLGSDIALLNDALSRLGTSETSLNDVLFGRSNADLKAIKVAYAETYKKSLESHIKSDLSGKTERLFLMILSATRPEDGGTYFDAQSIDTDVREIYHATESQKGTDEIAVCAVFCNSSDTKLRAIAQGYMNLYHRPLEKVVRDEFTGHMEDALLFMLAHAEDPVKHHAAILRSCLGSAAATDQDAVATGRLTYWLVRLHWDRPHFEAVKRAFHDLYGFDLRTRLKLLLGPTDFASLIDRLCG